MIKGNSLNSLKVAIIQISSGLDYQENLKKIQNQIDNIGEKDVEAIFLPECFYSLSNGKEPSPYLVEKGNEHYENIRALAIKNNVALIGGTCSTLEDGKVVNRSYNFDKDGNLIDFYDKINLFSCDFTKDGVRKKVDEADIFTSGSEPKVIEFKGFKIGLAICFDLRFPNLLLNYYRSEVDIITFPSAFTVTTGKAHWEVLLRARAIEGQCYVVAAAQCGKNHPGVSTYGHSLVANPWGEVQASLDSDEGSLVVTLFKEQITSMKSKIHTNFKAQY